jgi:putative phosphoesterase
MAASVNRSELVVGVISDTHNHLYPEVKELLCGVDHIIHAGDVCSPTLLSELRAIAPLTVVRGNCDEGPWAADLPVRAEIELGGRRVLVGHIRAAQNGGVQAIDVVIFGHSHQALVEEKEGVLYLNPGAAGPRRYGRPRTMALLRLPSDGAAPSANIVVVEG